MWALDGYTAAPARTGEEGTREVDAGALDWICVGLPLGPDRWAQRRTKPTRFEIGVE